MIRRLGQTVVPAAIAASMFLAVNVQAAELSYDYLEGRFIDTEVDTNGGDIDGDGIHIGGSFTLAENWHAFASYETLDFDFDIDISAFTIGAGYMTSIAPQTDLVARLAYINGEADAGGFGDVDDSGFGLQTGFRHMFNSQFEGRAFLNYVDLDESGDETTFELAGDYFFNDQFSAGLQLEFGDDTTAFSIGGRYYFGSMRR